MLPLAVQTLIAVAEASDKSIRLWILHALLACANAAGLAFVPHVKPTLGLAQVGAVAGRRFLMVCMCVCASAFVFVGDTHSLCATLAG